MKKKAEAAKAAGKKTGKASIANVAKKAIEERDAKNKTKKVYVDLWMINWCYPLLQHLNLIYKRLF